MIEFAHRYVIPAAYSLLPAPMASDAATRMLLAIGWQESRWTHRRQMGGGPATSFLQFETAGVSAVLAHSSTKALVRSVLQAQRYLYEPTPYACHSAIEHNDVLAIVFGRLLLWTDPDVMPQVDQPDLGWRIYRRTWRPGKPKPETWPDAWRAAVEALA